MPESFTSEQKYAPILKSLSFWLCIQWQAQSIAILRLIKCGYNQGLIMYWSSLQNHRVLNNAIPRALLQLIHRACEQSLWLLLSGDLVWCGTACLISIARQQRFSWAVPPDPPCPYPLVFFFSLMEWSDKTATLSHNKPSDSHHVKWANIPTLGSFMRWCLWGQLNRRNLHKSLNCCYFLCWGNIRSDGWMLANAFQG